MSGSTLNDEFQNLICDEVQSRRGRGLKAAFNEVARLFGLTERRVRAAWHHEIRTVTADEWQVVRACRVAALRARQAQIAHEIDVLGRELDDQRGRM
jgi:hypothetical protein